MKKKLFACCLLVGTFPSFAFGLGFRLTDMDAEATAKGGAFAATADNPSAIFYNPAGITQLEGLDASFNTYSVYINDEFKAPDGKKFGTSDQIQTIPHLYTVYAPENFPVAFGLGAYSPYGLAIQWPDETPFRTLTHRGQIKYLTVNPVVAVQVSRTFSVAAGFTANFAETTLERGLPSFPGVFQSTPGDFFNFKGSGAAYGFTLGALWTPLPQHSFGVSYHSATDVEFSGHTTTHFSKQDLRQIDALNRQIQMANDAIQKVKANVPAPFVPQTLAALGLPANEIEEVPTSVAQDRATAKLHFPQFVIGGYSFRPTPDWNFEINVDWTDWDSLNTVVLHDRSTKTNTDLPFNWTSSFIYEFGASRKFSNGLHLDAGYIYSENSVPESQFNPAIPDSERHVWSLGVGLKRNRASWDIGYQFAWGPNRTIDNGSLADGRYRFISHAITCSFAYSF